MRATICLICRRALWRTGALVGATAATAGAAVQDRPAPPLAVVAANDNRRPAGRAFVDGAGAVDVVLTARVGRWYPDGRRRPAPLVVPAFAEGDGPPSVPGPLIRVRAGTRVRVTIRNRLDGPLAGAPLVVHGLQRRPDPHGSDPRGGAVTVPAGGAREVAFEAGAPGTYYYWGALDDSSTVEGREGIDAALSGAIIVDPVGGPVERDRVFVLGRMALPAEGTGALAQPRRFVVTVNGLSWPHTERLAAAVGDSVRWRWVNATNEHHPMHLHGFYFRVDALGDQRADTLYGPARRKLVVTERMEAGGTMSMTWRPERAGNWLVHCHLRAHSGPDSTWGFPDVPGTPRYGSAPPPPHGAAHEAPRTAAPHVGHDMERDMAGLVVGMRVHPAAPAPATAVARPAGALPRGTRHEVRLTVSRAGAPQGALADAPPMIAAAVEDPRRLGGRRAVRSANVGPPIVLRRDVPARITVVNRLPESTALHWHGLELESYYDGVPGWTGGPGGGGAGGRLSPVIPPGGSFGALMTPPRAGTFIYHSHALSTTQLGDGLYGALVVLAPGEAYDPAREVTWIVGGRERGEGARAFLLLNGERAPAPLTLVAGRRYRVRLINITESNTADVALLGGDAADSAPLAWRPVAKDAVPLPHMGMTPARVRTSVGETFDFELVPAAPGVRWLEVRNGGDLMVRQRVVVR